MSWSARRADHRSRYSDQRDPGGRGCAVNCPIGSTRSSGTTVRMANSASAPDVAWQPSLWANQGTRVDVSFCGLERMQLDADSWVDHCPGWMSGSDQAFEELLRDVAWSQRRRWMYDRQVDEPRLTSWQKSDQQGPVTFRWQEEARASLS